MNNTLKTWIAESESWQSFVDFDLPIEARANYPFLKRSDDFYLSVMHNCLSSLKGGDMREPTQDLLALAKGLEIFSLKGKRDEFKGVNQSNNILYASALYYLSDYSASAWILAKVYPKDDYQAEVDIFIYEFLKRKLSTGNPYTETLKSFLATGNIEILDGLIGSLTERCEVALDYDIYEYTSCLLAIRILGKFKADNIWYDLLGVNSDNEYWLPFIKRYLNLKVPVWSFFPSQKTAIQSGVLAEKTFSLQMPTSSGKTFLSELIIYDELKSKRSSKILYLAPFRALASELKISLAKNLASLGVTSKTIFGGNIPTAEERNSIDDADLLISTPEKFLAIEDIFPELYDNFNTIICDEGHLLDDNTRGLSYELLLSRLKGNDADNKRFIFISAIIPNIGNINSWLGGDNDTLVSSDYRPTELEYAFLFPMGGENRGFNLNVNPTDNRPKNYQLYKFLDNDDVDIPKVNSRRSLRLRTNKAISAAVALKAVKSGSVALFATQKRGNTGVEGLVEELIKQIEWREDTTLKAFSSDGFLQSLVDYFTVLFGDNYLLVNAVQNGILYHHGDFPQGVREIIEDTLRSGNIRLVVCTNTLAEGVNLPIKTIVLHSIKRYDPSVLGRYIYLSIRDLKNLVGRAGRAGKETKGLIIVPNSNDFDYVRKLIEDEQLEPVNGRLYNIIKSITSIITADRLQLSNEILDEQDEEFKSLLDSIDLSLIDLLAEEITIDNLYDIVQQLVPQTLSYHQSDEEERKTLNEIFSLRAEKIEPFIETGDFGKLKRGGTSIRLYDDIVEKVDFENAIWRETFDPIDDEWVDYILEECLFRLDNFSTSLATFNELNRCIISEGQVKQSIKLWINGKWYHELAEALGIEIHHALKFINSFISYNVQSTISSIIRLKEVSDDEYDLPDHIINWSAFLQYGISKQQQLDLFEMGLIDRVAVYGLSDSLDSNGYVHEDYKNLKGYILQNQRIILASLSEELPRISREKISNFIHLLNYKAII